MAIIANFIGIDKHLDPKNRDLSGARRDATALWALFADSIEGISAKLLVDVDATLDRIRQVLDETLGVASEDDVVILSFSGHGTHNHRLVAHNSAFDTLDQTTLPMDELAKRFRTSRARAIVCILDCCFSGGAPARVLEDSPVARDPTTPLSTIAGNGRILITASGIDEEAWELPGSGHGILTKAIIDAVRDNEGPVSVTAIMDKVMDRTRVEAARIHVQQTPVLLGYVEGGLVFPRFTPGERFFKAFPEARGIHIGTDITELDAFGYSPEIVSGWKVKFPGGLNELQHEAVNEYRILDGESLLVVAPTSSGKTFIGELAAARAITARRKAVLLLPYRALVSEKYEEFEALYGALGMRVIRCTGDYSDQTGGFIRGKYDLGILTYEMFLNLVVSTPSTLNQIGLVVLDEAQFLTDPSRGISVELLLTLLLTARERGISPQLVALSAVIGGTNDLDSWLGCRKLVNTHRPVPLTEGVLGRDGVYQFLNPDGSEGTIQLLPFHAVRVRRDKPSAQDVIVPLARHLIGAGEQVIIFRNQRGPAQGCAAYLAKELALPPAQQALGRLPSHDLSSTSAVLRECLEGGTAFHNTNLTREEKAVVEQAFRDPNGGVRVLAATTTVAAGINTPASTVILAEQEFIGEDGRPFTVAEYKNMAGRAGRLGFNEQGKAIILAETTYDRSSLFQKYVLGKPEEITSSFDPSRLPTWAIRLLAQVPRVARAEISKLLANSYGGFLASRDDPNWRHRTVNELEELLGRMLTLGLVEEEAGFVRLTLLGRACGRSALSFESAMRLVDLLRSNDPATVTAERLVAIVQALPESDGGYTPLMKRGRAESVRPREASERYGPDAVRGLQKYAQDEFDYFARCKRAAILWDWITGVPVETIEQRFSPNPFQGRIHQGDIRRFADATRFHLRSAHQILSVLFVEEGPSEEAIEALLRRLEVGIPAGALRLLDLPVSLSRGEYLALFSRGVDAADKVWAMPTRDLASIIGSGRADDVLKNKSELGQNLTRPG
jgi:replicative superfamily II helicase